jgi:hypothetical protein
MGSGRADVKCLKQEPMPGRRLSSAGLTSAARRARRGGP